jgi:flagellar protein FlbD
LFSESGSFYAEPSFPVLSLKVAGNPADDFNGRSMINLTRLNNQSLTVNSDLIKFVEKSPDTVITLVTGEKIIVRETAETVVQRYIEFRRLISERNSPLLTNGSPSARE